MSRMRFTCLCIRCIFYFLLLRISNTAVWVHSMYIYRYMCITRYIDLLFVTFGHSILSVNMEVEIITAL